MQHVLLIEPDSILANAYAAALRHAGYSTAHAPGAQAAIQEADERVPDVVVLEVQLAAHDGVEFLHEFRSYPDWQHVPVLINTHLMPDTWLPVREALERDYGVTVCLYKPRTTLEQLIRHVHALAQA